MKRGLFITFEGPDGSGKTTQAQLLRGFLAGEGYDVYLTREPGGTRIGERIRDILLDRESAEMSDVTEMLLYAASRAQHVDEVIRPRLESGQTVISDRFVDSSIVYQGYGRKLGDKVGTVNGYAIGDCTPDITFLLMIDPEAGLGRLGRGGDRIETAGLEYHREVHDAYLRLEGDAPGRIVAVDAGLPKKEVHELIKARATWLMKEHYGGQ